MSPAEDALIATGERGGGLHAEMRFNAIKGVFVAGAAAAEGGFGPAADLDTGVGADDCIALFCQGGVGGGGFGDHFLEVWC